MIEEIKILINEYSNWLKDKTALKEMANFVEITTPYLDRHNDYFQIYIKKDNGSYILSDGGYVIEDLKQSGCDIETPKRKNLLQMTLNGFGVQLNENEISIYAYPENFPLKKHNLIQAMLAVNDLFYLSVSFTKSLFLEDVAQWLDLSDIRYTPSVKFTGKSGFDHYFDFVIPHSKKKPERILKAINKPNRDTAEALAFSWIDTREVRITNSKAYAFLNDSDTIPQPSILDALKNYDVTPILWSKKEEIKEELTA